MPVFHLEAANADEEIKEINRKYKGCINAARFRVKWKDIFNLKDFYRALHEWFLEYEWLDMEDKIDHYETLYFEKIGHFGDKELWLRWRPQKKPSNSEYYKYHIDLDFHFLYLVPTEVVREGKKFKKDVYKGEMEVWITALVEPDYKNEWAKHPFLKYFNKLFTERIFRTQLYDEHKRELYREVYILQNYIKQWFKLKRYLPYEEVELFYPSGAYDTYRGGENGG